MMYPVRIVDHGVAVGVVDQGGKQVMVLYGIVLYCTILYYTVLYCSIPYYTVLYCTILYYTILYRTVQVVEQQGGAGGGARWSKEQGGAEAISWIQWYMEAVTDGSDKTSVQFLSLSER